MHMCRYVRLRSSRKRRLWGRSSQQANEDQQNQLEEDDNFNTENYCDFTVYIKNAGDKGGLVVDATSMDTEINYNNVFMTDDIEKEK